LEQRCPCGHDGATLSNLFGRGKNFVRLPNGRLKGFHVSTRLLQEAVSFKECRVRQPDLKTIAVEISRPNDLTADEETKLKQVIVRATDPAFDVIVKSVKEIDWSTNPKRLFFSSAVA
jgi:phenylacetate-CoA ligase